MFSGSNARSVDTSRATSQGTDRARFDGWSEAIVHAGATGNPLAAQEAAGSLFAYFAELAERRRLEPADDTVSDLVRLMGTEGTALLRTLGFAFTMIAGGNDTVIGLLGTAFELLTERPDVRAALIADPARIPRAVEEFLRMASPVQALARTATEDVERYGEVIPKGRKVLLLYGSANRDPREYGPDAAEVDIDRAVHQHAAFGFGPHHCLGASAARLQGRVVLEELLVRFPEFSVDAARGTFAAGNFVRRYQSLPFTSGAAGIRGTGRAPA